MTSDITTCPLVRALVEHAPEGMRSGIYAGLQSIDTAKVDGRGRVDVAMVSRCDANRVDHIALSIGGIVEGLVVGAFDPCMDDADACAWFNALWRVRNPQDRFTDYDRGLWLRSLITACAQALMDQHRGVPNV